MQHKIVWGTLRLTIVSLIAFFALMAFVAGYQALFLEITGQFLEGLARGIGALVFTVATGLLLRYRGELVDELA